jgi:molybdopterin-containing oxidoreductase family membrane subunit
MVLLLCIPIRNFYGLQAFIKIDHLEVMAKLVLATSFITSYGYLSEQFGSRYGCETAEHYTYWNRLAGFGQYAVITWLVLFCNTIAPQVLWFRWARRNQAALVVVSLIILTSLHRDYLPSSWGMFKPTIWDFATYFGSAGLFFCAFLLFARLLPMISMSEMRALLPGSCAAEEGR